MIITIAIQAESNGNGDGNGGGMITDVSFWIDYVACVYHQLPVA